MHWRIPGSNLADVAKDQCAVQLRWAHGHVLRCEDQYAPLDYRSQGAGKHCGDGPLQRAQSYVHVLPFCWHKDDDMSWVYPTRCSPCFLNLCEGGACEVLPAFQRDQITMAVDGAVCGSASPQKGQENQCHFQ